jgi:hypothetical protein
MQQLVLQLLEEWIVRLALREPVDGNAAKKKRTEQGDELMMILSGTVTGTDVARGASVSIEMKVIMLRYEGKRVVWMLSRTSPRYLSGIEWLGFPWLVTQSGGVLSLHMISLISTSTERGNSRR